MDLFSIQTVAQWLSANPGWAGVAVFTVAFGESLALLGLFVPGAVLMFATGALIGTGHLEFLPMAAWAITGAFAGDTVSFWIGRRFRDQLCGMWPFRTHPALLERGTGFFLRHGGKGVLLGRFVGPIRPVIPAVAGMLEMPARRFVLINLFSALLWAPAYLLPGVLFGASLGLAAEVAGRLAVLLVILLVLAWGLFSLAHRSFEWFHPRAHAVLIRLLDWGRLHPRLGRIPVALLDPNHPEAKALSGLALLMAAAIVLFFGLLDAVGASGLVENLDHVVFNNLRDLRTPLMNTVMVAITHLGDVEVLLPLFLAVLAWLLLRRNWSAAGHWFAAGAFTLVLVSLLKAVIAVTRPTADLYSGVSAFSFPSGHATHSTVLFGFLAVLLARELRPGLSWLPYSVAAVAAGLVSFSRLYLGAHWVSDVLGGIAIGVAWVAALGIGYRRHPSGNLTSGPLAVVAGATIMLTWSWHSATQLESSLERYQAVVETRVMRYREWWSAGWASLPRWRDDLRDRHAHPLTVQYAGSLAELRTVLAQQGWHAPVAPDGRNWLLWLAPTEPEQLPLLPQVHNGHYEALRLVRRIPDQEPLAVLRLWPSEVELTAPPTELWVGNVSWLEPWHPLPGFTVPRTGTGFDRPQARLAGDTTALLGRVVKSTAPREDWSGRVLLLAEPAPSQHAAFGSQLGKPLQPFPGVLDLQQFLAGGELEGQ